MSTFSLLKAARIAGWKLFAASGLLLLSACAVGPDYQQPAMDVGAFYKEAVSTGRAGSLMVQKNTNAPRGWGLARPGDATRYYDWWEIFRDPVLTGLMEKLQSANLNIVQAEAQYRQAQALLQSARSGFFPAFGASGSAVRSGSGSNNSGGGSGSMSPGGDNPGNQYTLSGNVSWEVDLWGKVRRDIESNRAALEASAADVANTRLSMLSTLAQTYFRLRVLDAEQRLLQQTVKAYERSLELTLNRYTAGMVAKADVAVSRTQLENTRAQLLPMIWQRAQLEHALAVLVGLPPSGFTMKVKEVLGTTPVIPEGLPSQLLERRPDIVAAERRVAEANAKIGVAQAAWFPDLTLSAQAGFRNGAWAQWLTAPASFWSLGPALALTLFDGGARQAQLEQARAGYDIQVAAYRLTVLTALREVEDYLAQLYALEQEQDIQGLALKSARESLRLTQNQYDAGLIDYLSVVQVETTALSTERAALQLTGDRLVASVQLIAALGGGWEPRGRGFSM